MTRAVKKKKELTLEEKLAEALVPVEEQLYQVPENWCWVKLGSLATDMADGPFGSNLKTEHYTTEKEARIIQLSNIGEDGWREDNTKYTTFRHAKEIARSIVNPGDIVIAKMMPAGRAIICPNNEKMYILSSDAVKMVPLKSLNIKYLVYGINSPFFRNQVQGNTQGITRARTSIKKLKDYTFMLPPLPEQQRIVDRIESLFAKLDEAKERAQAVVDGFEDRKASILHKAFTGELTAAWRNEKKISLSTWKNVIMQDVCEKITCGKTPKDFISNEGEIPYLKVYNIVNNEVAFEKAPQYIPLEIHNGKLSSSILKPNDVIMNIVGPPLRKIAIIPDTYKEWNMNQAIVRFRPKEGLYYRYLYYALINPETLDAVIIATRGVVGQANISVSQSRNLKILIPTLEEQKEIVRVLDILLMHEIQAKEAAEQVISQIETMKKSILARAFRGELGTNDPADESAVELLKRVL